MPTRRYCEKPYTHALQHPLRFDRNLAPELKEYKDANVHHSYGPQGGGYAQPQQYGAPPPQQQMNYGPPQGQYQQGPPPKEKKDRGCLMAW
jgi:hypothetical protein